jgi:hypothetical protein
MCRYFNSSPKRRDLRPANGDSGVWLPRGDAASPSRQRLSALWKTTRCVRIALSTSASPGSLELPVSELIIYSTPIFRTGCGSAGLGAVTATIQPPASEGVPTQRDGFYPKTQLPLTCKLKDGTVLKSLVKPDHLEILIERSSVEMWTITLLSAGFTGGGRRRLFRPGSPGGCARGRRGSTGRPADRHRPTADRPTFRSRCCRGRSAHQRFRRWSSSSR